MTLIGRSRELALLDEGVRGACAGTRAIVLITGEPGIGKTSLLDELAARMTAAGGTAVWGRTWEVGLTPAYWPWTQVLGALGDAGDPAPELVGLDDRSDAASRLARFDDVAAFLVRRAAVHPLAVLFDDMHASDASSVLLLDYLARHVRSARLLVALTARDGEAAPDVELALARIRREAKRIVVGRLAAEDVATLVGARAAPALVERVQELAGGNPLFVEELVASIEAHGGLDGVARTTGVRALIRDRVARLPDPRTLAVAALTGRDFKTPIVADVLGLSADELDARLAPAIQLGVIARDGERCRFSHALVAETLAEELTPSEAAELHLVIGRALARHEGDDAASAIAHHLLAASHLEPDAAAAAAERAASVAMAQLAFEAAAALLERAVAALPPASRRRAALLCAQAEALQHAGEHARAAALCDRAAQLAREANDGVLLARIALARGIQFQFGTIDRVLVDLLREALAAMPETDSSLRARCLARLAAAEQPAFDPGGPIRDAREAIAMARRVGDRRTRLDVIHVAIAALIDYVPPAELAELLEELFVLATSPGDRLILLRDRLRHCFVALDLGDRAALDVALAAHAELAAAIGIPRLLWPVRMLAAMVALFEGRFDDARAAAADAEALAGADPQLERALVYHRFIAAFTRTEPTLPYAKRIGELYPHVRSLMHVIVAMEHGEHDKLAAVYDAAAVSIAKDPVMDSSAVDALHLLGDPVRARQSYDRIRPSAGRIWVASMTGFALTEIADRALLVLADAAHLDDAIDAHATAAVAAAERLGAVPWLARIRADWARALERRDRPGDRERARALYRAARDVAERLAMPGLLARCAAVAPSPRPAPIAAAPAAPDEPVSIAREGELWLVRGRGQLARVRDSRGIRMLAQLVADPHREIHAIDLVGGDSGGADTGDAGELLDAKAKAAYRRRLTDLTQELEEAEAWADPVRAAKARAEIEQLTAELQRAIGLGGRDRKAGSASERARSNAQRRLAHAIQQIRAAAPRLADHLAKAVRTGVFCVYDPK